MIILKNGVNGFENRLRRLTSTSNENSSKSDDRLIFPSTNVTTAMSTAPIVKFDFRHSSRNRFIPSSVPRDRIMPLGVESIQNYKIAYPRVCGEIQKNGNFLKIKQLKRKMEIS